MTKLSASTYHFAHVHTHLPVILKHLQEKSLTTCLVISHISSLTQEKSAAKSFTIGIMILAPVSHQLPLETIILIGVEVQPLPVSMITRCQSTCDQLKVSRGISHQRSKVVANASSLGIRQSV